MKKFWVTGIAILLLIVLSACGGASDSTDEEASSTEPAAAAPTAVPSATDTPEAATEGGVSAKLQAYADEHAGKPGAIYIGDINQLVGPAATEDQGDFDGNVPLDALQNHLFVFESDYYRGLIEQANVENPTELVERDEVFTIQHACLNRALSFCKVTETFYSPRLLSVPRARLIS
jgi:hypothetical protein